MPEYKFYPLKLLWLIDHLDNIVPMYSQSLISNSDKNTGIIVFAAMSKHCKTSWIPRELAKDNIETINQVPPISIKWKIYIAGW